YIRSSEGVVLPRTVRCELNRVSTRRFVDAETHLIDHYGTNFLLPSWLWVNGTWVARTELLDGSATAPRSTDACCSLYWKSIPKRSPSWDLEWNERECVVYVGDRIVTRHRNPTAALVLSMCDGTKTAGELRNELAEI